MQSMPLPASFGWLLVIFGVIAVWTFFFFAGPMFNGDYVDEHVGRGSIEDDWGLDVFDE